MIDLQTTQKNFLRVGETAEIFGKCQKTIYNWINAGKLKYVRVMDHGPYMIPIQSVRDLFAARTAKANRNSSSRYKESAPEAVSTT